MIHIKITENDTYSKQNDPNCITNDTKSIKKILQNVIIKMR